MYIYNVIVCIDYTYMFEHWIHQQYINSNTNALSIAAHTKIQGTPRLKSGCCK